MKAKKIKYKKVDHAVLQIVNELIGFSMHNGAEDLKIDIKDSQLEVCISVISEASGIDDSIIDTAKRYLDMPRQHDVEGCYGELAGDDIDDNELSLIGMMTDKAELIYDGKTLNIMVVRKK